MAAADLRGRFGSDEWEDIKLFPGVVFALVAGVDADVDATEWTEYAEEIEQGATARDPLQVAVLVELAQLSATERRDLVGRADALFRQAGAVEAWAARVRDALEEHLDDREYHRFTTAMVLFGAEVADSSGTDDPTEVDFEATALGLLVEMLSIDIEAGTRALAAN